MEVVRVVTARLQADRPGAAEGNTRWTHPREWVPRVEIREVPRMLRSRLTDGFANSDDLGFDALEQVAVRLRAAANRLGKRLSAPVMESTKRGCERVQRRQLLREVKNSN